MNFKKNGGFPRIARTLAPVLAFVVVGIGLAVPTGWGTPSSFGWGVVSSVCPVGMLEALVGGWGWAPRIVIEALIVVAAALFLGRSFCGWVCPVPRISKVLRGKRRAQSEKDACRDSARRALVRWKRGERPLRRKLDARHAVLGGALVSSALFGFPVFCLVCPVGLTFATFVLVWRTFQFGELSWGIVVFPAIVVLEVVAMRKWCAKFCPIGALLSLLSSDHGAFRVSIDHSLCLRNVENASCIACGSACTEHIDPFDDLGERPLSECTRCHRCAESCPVQAIKMPLLPAKDASERSE